MKKSTFLFLFFAALAVSATSQNEVMLHLAPRLGSAVFSLNAPFTHPSATYSLKYTRFEYYISEIKVTHDGGQITPCTGLHLLVRPALDSMYSLGQMPTVDNIEAITFSVGVEQAVNHLDPASYPADDPLAPQNPAMQWGWTAGYRFAAIEGDAGTNLAQHFEVHALGDENYKTQTIVTVGDQVAPDMKMIHIVADYSQAVKSITLSSGLIVHGTTGAAVTLLNNFKNIVFKSALSGVNSPLFSGAFAVTPNPVTLGSNAQVRYTLLPGNTYELTIADMAGKIIARQPLQPGQDQLLELAKMPSAGAYLVQLWQNARPVSVEKLIVLN